MNNSIKKRKGIILAGGLGSRLSPLTISISKQLLPIYDKPMIYYPLTTLMMSGVKEILIICRKDHLSSFKKLLGNGHSWGLSIEYACQKKPEGIAQAFLIAEQFLKNSSCVLILGDNLFHGNNLISQLQNANKNYQGATLFVYPVSDPWRYGVVNFNKKNEAISIEEKPKKPSSNYAVTGIYFFDNKVINFAKELKPSSRGELEISDINQRYLDEKKLNIQILGRGMAWLDTGTFDALQEAGEFIRTIEKRQGLKVGCPEEIAWRTGLINDIELRELVKKEKNQEYGKYLKNLLEN
ncbi:glucose-1-phosphate thymidylyltransferase RfbA [Prochlorococcus sp. AH-736-L23]|nr:glucose-1-phosphate thymidylyltransferase RfbA [Prochlorococcus sp. AH-736-L23]